MQETRSVTSKNAQEPNHQNTQFPEIKLVNIERADSARWKSQKQ